MKCVNFGYDSTNYYILDAPAGKMLIDCGWPGTLPKLSAELRRKGIGWNEVKYLLVTHFHPDHAGIVQDIKNHGVKFMLLESQPQFIAEMTELFKRKKLPYLEIEMDDNVLLKFDESRAFLSKR